MVQKVPARADRRSTRQQQQILPHVDGEGIPWDTRDSRRSPARSTEISSGGAGRKRLALAATGTNPNSPKTRIFQPTRTPTAVERARCMSHHPLLYTTDTRRTIPEHTQHNITLHGERRKMPANHGVDEG